MLFRLTTNSTRKLFKSLRPQRMHQLPNNSSSEASRTTWTPENYLTASKLKEQLYAVIILNRPIHLDQDFVIEMWNSAQFRHTVDGGTDRWLTFLEGNPEANILHPDMITGDFDSVKPDTLSHFESLNCEVIRTQDQNETDFTKALRQLAPRLSLRGVETVIVLADTSGRLDQIMANINTLFKAQNFAPDLKIFIMSSNSLSWLLPPGHHTIDIPPNVLEQKVWCSLIPIGHKCVLSTRGLKWDMTNKTTQFGGLVSTSNTYSGSPAVDITTGDHVLWCMGTRKEKD
ncbi:thiamin pyrophosphokinase 1 [Phlebotomus papatasi]|uniref:thiamin pyrophosphokinase 1 n=1 Tax=Phlebotomus papatasi TaxID=29031 RepID=UPI0024835598|nr:thiamin pyrophosphokinase 1 [Phlebotomus papatasi]